MMTSARWCQLGLTWMLTWQWRGCWHGRDDVSRWPAARGSRGSILAKALFGVWGRVESPMRPILLRWCISEKDDFNDDGGELIGPILVTRRARGKAAESLTDVWQRVDGQIRMIPTAVCRALENLHGDMSYILIGGPMWKIRRRQWSWWRWSSFWGWRFNLGTSNSGGVVMRGHGKGLLTDEVEAVENTNKDRTARHKKIRAMALIPC